MIIKSQFGFRHLYFINFKESGTINAINSIANQLWKFTSNNFDSIKDFPIVIPTNDTKTI